MKMIQYILISLLFVGDLYSGELIINPKKPVVGDKLELIYQSNSTNKQGEKIRALIYVFSDNESMPNAYDIELKYNPVSKKYTEYFTLKNNDVFGIIKIVDVQEINSITIDNNQGNFWDFYIYDSKGNIKSNSRFRAGLSYLGSMPENCQRNVFFDKALENLEEEIKNYPDNLEANIGLLSLQYDLKKVSKENFEESLIKLINSKKNTNVENELKSIVRALNTLNRNSEANNLISDYIEKNPTSSLAQENYLSQLSQIDNIEDFTNSILDYINKFPLSQNRERLFSALASAFLQNSDVIGLINTIKNIDDVPSNIYNMIAKSIITDEGALANSNKQKRLEYAIAILDTAIKIERNYNIKYKPVFLSEFEWEQQKNNSLAKLFEHIGELYFLAQNESSALSSFLISKKYYGSETPISIYNNLINTYDKKNDSINGYMTASEAIVESKNTPKSDSIHKLMFSKIYSDTSKYKNVIDSLDLLAKNVRKNNIQNNLIYAKYSLGTIKAIDGTIIDLSKENKTNKVILFWSSWCEPCFDAIEAVSELTKMYKDYNEFSFYIIDVWEKEEDRKKAIQTTLKENKITATTFIDDYDILPKNMGIVGLPTLVLVDKEGITKYKKSGIADIDDYLQGIVDLMEVFSKPNNNSEK